MKAKSSAVKKKVNPSNLKFLTHVSKLTKALQSNNREAEKIIKQLKALRPFPMPSTW